ncbi:MAG: hypothetical protein ACK5KP_07265 [Paludibacteraceae bacterium]
MSEPTVLGHYYHREPLSNVMLAQVFPPTVLILSIIGLKMRLKLVDILPEYGM